MSIVSSLAAREYRGRTISFEIPDGTKVQFNPAAEREDYVIVYEDKDDPNNSVRFTLGIVQDKAGTLKLVDLVAHCNQGVLNSAKQGSYRLVKEASSKNAFEAGILKGALLYYPIVLRNGDKRALRYYILDDGTDKWMGFYDSARQDDVFAYTLLKSVKRKK